MQQYLGVAAVIVAGIVLKTVVRGGTSAQSGVCVITKLGLNLVDMDLRCHYRRNIKLLVSTVWKEHNAIFQRIVHHEFQCGKEKMRLQILVRRYQLFGSNQSRSKTGIMKSIVRISSI